MNKKITSLVICTILLYLIVLPLQAFAQEEEPILTGISFKNAEISGEFNPDVHEYNLILNNNETPPTLKDYTISGNANIFITYTYDEINHQIGLTATLQYDMGSAIYNFTYANPPKYERTKNNLLSAIYCTYGELSPALNNKDTVYKLYIPSDLTQLTITPVTEDIQAYCAPIELILAQDQTPKITFYSIASDGSKREYLLNIKRVDKTINQVKQEMMEPNFKSFVDGTRVYQRPEFLITVFAAGTGLLVLLILFRITRKIAINPYDRDEKPFYKIIE